MISQDTLTQRVLVVDDEPYVCDIVRMILAFDGHHVDAVGSGKEALALFEKGNYDLVITDYSMPVMKGDALAAAIKARAPHQPILMITGCAEMLHSTGRPLAGVDRMMSKPFNVADLRSAVTSVLAKRIEPPGI